MITLPSPLGLLCMKMYLFGSYKYKCNNYLAEKSLQHMI